MFTAINVMIECHLCPYLLNNNWYIAVVQDYLLITAC